MMRERNVEQLYWDNITLQGRVDRLESRIADLALALDNAVNRLTAMIGDSTSAAFEAIDESRRDWRQNR